MKKAIGCYMLFLIGITILSGCGPQKSEPKDNEDNAEMMKEDKMEEEDNEMENMEMEENNGDQMEMTDTMEMEKESME